ncbi:hypothetical protein [Polyangium sp. 15x6]|uniref:hypothetical protein n=1 Tax=Polyangium sp. 15x6 TaxID=3042687 RepID=UPI00249C3CA5|nr:hypothetical protein [Polyangium sp. 15x6]MDI3288760.1 hypothetical protein [Polyangium sp. 15x6]
MGDRGAPADPTSTTAYRMPPEGPMPETEPVGELVEPAPEDRRSLARLQSRERSRVVGMVVTAVVLLRWGVPLAPRIFGGYGDLASIAFGAGAIALFVYAFWSWANPRVVVPSVVRIDGHDDEGLSVTLDHAFSLRVVLNPRNTLALDPLLVRFVAEEVSRKKEPVFSAEYILDQGRSVDAGKTVRYDASIELPGEAPCTSHKRGIAWRLEVSVGAPPGFTRAYPLHVRPAARSARAPGKKVRQRRPKVAPPTERCIVAP